LNRTNEEQAWHEIDEKWELWEQVLFDQQRIEAAPAQVDAIISLLQIKENELILDLCCGVGRHSLEFARRGFNVVGVDRTKAYLDKARSQMQKEGLSVEFVLEDMRRFKRPESFNIVISMFTSFGYFEDQRDQIRVLDNIYASLKPRGRVLIDVKGKECLARVFRRRDWYRHELGLVLEEREVEKDWSWIKSTWILIRDNEAPVQWNLSHWIYSAVELKSMLSQAGFEELQAFGSLSQEAYDDTSKRLIVVGKKPQS
jgi:SAM-dependent methyltransferase